MAGLDVHGAGGRVTRVRNLDGLEGGDVLRVVVRPQKQRSLTDRGRTEARSGPEGGGAVEGGSEHGNLGSADVRQRRQSGKGTYAGEPRYRQCIDLSDRAILTALLVGSHGGQRSRDAPKL